MSLISHSTASSSSSSRNHKICLVSEFQRGCFDYTYEVFVIDLGSCSGGRQRRRGPRQFRNPLFQIPKYFPISMGFFAFQSSIYFLGGYRAFEAKVILPTDVFVYDTSSCGSTIKKVSGMNRGKCYPVIIGPVDGKFYVISKCLVYRDFEKFDPKLGSWDLLCQPPVTYRPFPDEVNEYCISAYALSNDRKILMSTPSGFFSYDIDMDNWYFNPEASIPFGPSYMEIEIPSECAVSMGGDRFLGFIKEEEDEAEDEEDCHVVLGTYRYNSNEHTWDDFQHIYAWPMKYETPVYPMSMSMSLGDDLFCVIVSEYDIDSNTHCVSIKVFGDGPKFKCLHSRQYKEEYKMKCCVKNIAAAFPWDSLWCPFPFDMDTNFHLLFGGS
ncbi:uncharacterized protein LOC120010747 isoform X2 [Tripterygium wilfordii]|uniref:uncharacterized protein LOC120010747 isoform X2 n=1 Tax=Tripterygium wilfordii TaxID=458696 RepID=UPI0018F864D9|nr:uncharacterized protein LOC120010747 isoform X2 [Tripterygium wilfordii]